jgi:signal transduction histidine kinase
MSKPVIRVLFVDDDPKDYDMLRQMFLNMHTMHYQLDWVQHYADARKIMSAGEHDVYIVDYLLSLDEPNGLQLIGEVFPNGSSQAPVILLTAKGRLEVDEEALRIGVDEYFDKQDLRLPLLERTIRYALERKRTENQLRQSLERERELNELKSRFVSTVSHEFRTPLTVIRNNLYLIQNGLASTDERIKNRFSLIESQVSQLSAMVDDILTINKMEKGKIEFHPESVVMQDFCTDVIENFCQGLANPERLQADVRLNGMTMQLDRKLVRQMLTNLLDNAFKYSNDNTPVKFRASAEGTAITMGVQDYGIGIPEEDLPRLFDPFHRAGNVGTLPGSGVGLAIVKQAVVLHQGTVTVDSKLNEGTTFIITLPITNGSHQAQ